ncbi:hypothetical protein RQP53_18395 [Paucibacter sp. APW11]|uniref:Uncharacterized protein n=1 Tax=Roseateles aquae TaxID=3077235 RepID=A0ABU3PF98_9BURK|nr:hypothetical protein [Paucibacter sp. APW11]MDT9001255.1 hypothetical protein [Paucibacter sp. APW11]
MLNGRKDADIPSSQSFFEVSKLIKQSKFVKTAIAAAALGLAFGAQAASITGSAKYAVELFGGTAPQTAITLPALNITASTAIPAGSTVTIHVQYVGGRPAAANNATTATLAGAIVPTWGSTLAASTTAAPGTGTPTATTNNADVAVYTLAATTTSIGIGGNLLTIPAQTITAAGLATLGATVTANVSVFVGSVPAVVGGAVPTTGLLEAASGATTVASSAQGVTLTATAGSSSQKIDVTLAKPSSKFSTSTTASASDTGSASVAQLGTIGFVNGTAKQADGSTAYTVAQVAADGTVEIVVSAQAGFFAALGTNGSISLNAPNANACAGAVVGTFSSTAFTTAAAAAAATKVTFPATPATIAATVGGTTPAPYHVCYNIGTAGNGLLQPGTASITASLGQSTAAQDSTDTLASTNLLALTNNGATVDVPSYFPAALSQYGYSSYLRVVNKGSVSAPVSIAMIDPATGTAGTAQVIGTIPAGAATTFTGAQVEALIGALDKSARPRLRLTAPTAQLQVQSFVQSANGTFTEVSGGTQ